MNELNERLRVIKVQLEMERQKVVPNIEKIVELVKEEKKCLDLLRAQSRYYSNCEPSQTPELEYLRRQMFCLYLPLLFSFLF